MASSAYPFGSPSCPINVEDASDSSDEDTAPMRFKVRLFSGYRRFVWLPELLTLGQGSRWILVNTECNRMYKIEMLDDDGVLSMLDGVAIENLREERILTQIHNMQIPQLVINPGTTMTALVSKAIQQIFNKEYTNLIPKNHANIAMRFVGSDVIIPGGIKTYIDGNARMVKEWSLYAQEHQLTFGEVFVCKIHSGPTSWEFIGCCARRGYA